MSSQITVTQSSNTQTLAQIPGTYILIFSSCAPFPVYPNCIMKLYPTPLQVIIHQSLGRVAKRIQGEVKMAALNSIIYICTRALHSFLAFAHCHTAFTVISILSKTIFTPCFQPNHSLPHTCPKLTFAITTFLAVQYSSILSKCPNNLNTL